MVFNFKFKILNSGRGVTLVEIMVVVFLIGLFSAILMADFPGTQRRFALSRATYKLAQDIRRAEDMGLSGVSEEELALPAKGFGVFIDLNAPVDSENPQTYLLYADTAVPFTKYQLTDEIVGDPIEVLQQEQGVRIKRIVGVGESGMTSINFTPPNPTVDIDGLLGQDYVEIILGIEGEDEETISRSVLVYKSGLIEIK